MAFITDLNAYLESDSTLQTLTEKGTDLSFAPMVGYDEDEAPVILYWFSEVPKSTEQWYFIIHTAMYLIMDTDTERLFGVGERMKALLNTADTVSIPSASFIPKWSVMVVADVKEPDEREGWYYYKIKAEIGYVPNT